MNEKDRLAWVKRVTMDVAFGIHSNIPVCCIVAYVLDWDDSRLKAARDIERKMGGKKKWSYVPCWDCLRKRRVNNLHHCYPGCGGEKIVGRSRFKELVVDNQYLAKMFPKEYKLPDHLENNSNIA